jgi:hypothetical protein
VERSVEQVESLVAAHLQGVVEVATRNCVEEPLNGTVPIGSDGNRTSVFVLPGGGTTAWTTHGHRSIQAAHGNELKLDEKPMEAII